MAAIQKLQQLQMRGGLNPQQQELFDFVKQRGFLPEAQGPDPRAAVVQSLRNRPNDFRPVERDDAGNFTPPMDQSGNIASHRYGGTMSSGMEGVPPSNVSPEDLAAHYAEQQMLEEARRPISNTSISQGRRITAPADTEVRPWAQRTPSGYKERGLDPSQAPLQPQRAGRNAPITWPSAQTMSDEEIMRMLMGQ
jgi:hypothetical protein